MECNGLYLGDDILKRLFLNENFVFWFKFVSKTPVDCKPAWVPVPYRQEVVAWTDDGRVHWHNIYLHCNESNLCKKMIFISLSELFVFQHFVLELVSLKMFKISITELHLKIVHWHNINISPGPVVKLVTQFFFSDCCYKRCRDCLFAPKHSPGVGFTNFSVSKICDLAKVPVRFPESH